MRKRLRPLAMQASAAERAEKLRGQIASLEARIAQLDLASVAERRAETEARRAVVLEAQAAARAELERLLAERDLAEQELTDIAGSREATLAALYRLRGAVERTEIRREAVEGMAAELSSLLARSRESGSAEGRAELMALEGALAEAQAEVERAETDERECERALQRCASELAGLERIELARLEAESRSLLEKRTKVESDLAEAASLPEAAGRGLLALAAAVERLSLRRESLGASIERARAELNEAETLEQSGAPTYRELERAEAQAAVRERELALECDRLCERARHAAERLSTLERSIKEREGIPPAARALAETGELLALSLLEVEPGYEQAVAAALAWRAAALIAPDPKRGLDLLEKARREGLGNLAVVLASSAASGVASIAEESGAEEASPLAGARPLLELVSGDRRAQTLLQGIWLVPLEQLTQARSGVVVTREGHGYDALRGELWFAGSATEALMLELDSRRRSLEGEVARLFGEAAEAEKRLEVARRELKNAQKALSEVEPSRRRLLHAAFLARLVAGSSRLEQALQADNIGRILAVKLGKILNQAVWIENKGGGGGIIGANAVVHAAPDGYTLLLGQSGPISINPMRRKTLMLRPTVERSSEASRPSSASSRPSRSQSVGTRWTDRSQPPRRRWPRPPGSRAAHASERAWLRRRTPRRESIERTRQSRSALA